jgi:hypothetical protein
MTTIFREKELSTVPQFRVRTNLRGGADGGGYVNGVYYPDKSGICGTSPTPPPAMGGGWVSGVWYPDNSGVCGGTTTPTPPTTGGGYVNGVFYPDKSGVC